MPESLWANYHRTRSVEDRNELATFYLPIPEKIAKSFARKVPHHVDEEDLRSVGTMGLIDAIERYNPSIKRAFEPFAHARVRGSILDYLRAEDPFSRNQREKYNSAVKSSEKHFKACGLPLPEKELKKLLRDSFRAGFKGVPMNTPLSEFTDVDTREEDYLPVFGDTSSDVEQRDLINNLMRGLSREDRFIFLLYLSGNFSLRDISRLVGFSESYICIKKKRISRIIQGRLDTQG